LNHSKNEKVRKYTNLSPISNKTFIKYLEAVSKQVELKLKHELPNKFGLVFDGWSDDDVHYVALFACYRTKEGKTALPLLAFAPLLDETSFSASTHRDYIESSLQLYGKSLESLLFLTGDNCSTNKAVADLIGVPLVGCASHRLNLACKKAYEQAEDSLKKISSLMSKLSSLKNAGLRRQLTSVYPVKQNATRWTSTFHMVECYRKLKDIMPLMYDFDRTILDCSLSAREDHDLFLLDKPMKAMRQVALELQKDGLSLSHARLLFDALISDFPGFELERYIGHDSSIIHSKNFESGLVKILDGKEDSLTRQEQRAVSIFLKPDADQENGSLPEPENYVEKVYGQKKRKRNAGSQYMDVSFIPPTSNVVERMFSQAQSILTPHRKRLLPKNVEAILFLKTNRPLWDVSVVSEALRAPITVDD
jgi:hypothetical protein